MSGLSAVSETETESGRHSGGELQSVQSHTERKNRNMHTGCLLSRNIVHINKLENKKYNIKAVFNKVKFIKRVTILYFVNSSGQSRPLPLPALSRFSSGRALHLPPVQPEGHCLQQGGGLHSGPPLPHRWCTHSLVAREKPGCCRVPVELPPELAAVTQVSKKASTTKTAAP